MRKSHGVFCRTPNTQTAVLHFTLLFLFCGIIQSCVPAETRSPGTSSPSKYTVDGKTYGVVKGAFRHRWWNYYERGRSFSEGRFFDEAETDLKEAIRQRDGDQRMARTYGMHFIDYFPRRELGVAYLGQGRIDEAIVELETSIKQFRSAKAEFYLDQARKQQLESSGADRESPAVTISAPEPNTLVKGFTARVSGVATDDTYVKEVAVNGIPVRIDLSAPEIPYEVDVPLNYGVNTILVTATDLMDNVTVAKMQVRADRTGPMLSLESAELTLDPATNTVRLRGAIVDESGIQELLIDGQPVEMPDDGAFLGMPGLRPAGFGSKLFKWFAKKVVRLNRAVQIKPGQNRIVLSALDLAGNRTRAAVSFAASVRAQRPVLLAAGNARFNGDGVGLLAAASGDSAPFIELENVGENVRLFSDQLYLEIRIISEAGVKRIRVNDRPVIGPEGKNVFFGHLVPLGKGDNQVVINVEDMKGQVAEKVVDIHRNTYSIDAEEARLTVAVLPFERKGASSPLASGVDERVFDAVFDSRRFDLVERQQLDAVLQEQKLSETALVDQGTAIEVGRLVAAAGLVAGSVLENERSMEIYARLIDTETSLVLASVDVYGEPLDTRKLRILCAGLSLKLADALPREEGLVVKSKGKRILVDMGSARGIREGMRLVLFEPPEDELDDTRILGKARVTKVKDETAVAELYGDDAPKEVAVMTKVITQ
jgi:TolB-like protein